MKTLALYNIKGGVGKTAAAVNLSYLAARGGARTLIWDLDPQGASTFYFRVKARIKGGMKKVIEKKKDLEPFIRETDFENLDLLPADFSNRYMDIVLEGTGKPANRFRRMLAPLANRYDYLFLDCPPSMSVLSEAVFFSADLLVVPMIPTTLSIRTFEQLMKFGRKKEMGPKVRVVTFLSMVDRRRKLHRELAEKLPGEMPELLNAGIPYSSAVEKMGLHRKPIVSYAPGEPAGRAYESLWEEISKKIER